MIGLVSDYLSCSHLLVDVSWGSFGVFGASFGVFLKSVGVLLDVMWGALGCFGGSGGCILDRLEPFVVVFFLGGLKALSFALIYIRTI